MAKLTKGEEDHRRRLASGLESQPEGVVERLSVRFAWARRRVVEGRYRDAKRGEIREPVDTFDLWLEQRPGDPPREPDAREPTAGMAADRLAEYERWVRESA